MTCHRDGARHCSCAPAPLDQGPRLELHSFDPRAHAVLGMLAAPLAVEVLRVAQTASVVRGDIAMLLETVARSLPAAALPVSGSLGVPLSGPLGGVSVAGERPEPVVTLPMRAELLDCLQRSLDRQRPGTTTALVFCAVGDGDLRGPALAAVASRIRGNLRRSDLVAHCGRGRFVALLPDVPVDAAEVATERIVTALRTSLDEPVTTAEGMFVLRAMVGSLVCAPADAALPEADVDLGPSSAAALLGAVERAMEKASQAHL
ncbi:GGDEF domain-containing protein, diguanylate cyclase (c-di-GMP synthetase) or its enzymatically inactive variants [Quadrisphaera granulorum]|uniref:GGDEF domain-containing protein n=1 Tax=Quadrisphaera granulorum TaxID=317664 RepID=A0A315ZNP0_9ACTN|nr:diguanylate cyclase [Quadrisphaera granulorum]PWJ46488.1 GGDEF domain-containing protein [Quadrisphaera granulorum]SZE99046.1 GGDEF domain-containing protein, diguanylate cyclase (c-di-GMP synthetase) or its enzymatically inactive variants [Quadrisphaera granulorum]